MPRGKSAWSSRFFQTFFAGGDEIGVGKRNISIENICAHQEGEPNSSLSIFWIFLNTLCKLRNPCVATMLYGVAEGDATLHLSRKWDECGVNGFSTRWDDRGESHVVHGILQWLMVLVMLIHLFVAQQQGVTFKHQIWGRFSSSNQIQSFWTPQPHSTVRTFTLCRSDRFKNSAYTDKPINFHGKLIRIFLANLCNKSVEIYQVFGKGTSKIQHGGDFRWCRLHPSAAEWSLWGTIWWNCVLVMPTGSLGSVECSEKERHGENISFKFL